jgi:hypothetical protein
MDKNELAREIHKAINRLPEEMKAYWLSFITSWKFRKKK